jgi:hypothetical protein
MDDDVDEVGVSKAAAERSNAASSNRQRGDHIFQSSPVISRSFWVRPRRPRSEWK